MTEFRGKLFTFTTSNIQPADLCSCVRFLKRKEAIFSVAQKESIPNKILFSSEDNHQIKEKQ